MAFKLYWVKAKQAGPGEPRKVVWKRSDAERVGWVGRRSPDAESLLPGSPPQKPQPFDFYGVLDDIDADAVDGCGGSGGRASRPGQRLTNTRDRLRGP